MLTRAISAAFMLAGVGAGMAALGRLARPLDVSLLLALAAAFLVVGAGVWMERVVAWLIGLAIALLSVVAGVWLGGPWLVWSVVAVLFVVTAVQGVRDRAGTKPVDRQHADDTQR